MLATQVGLAQVPHESRGEGRPAGGTDQTERSHVLGTQGQDGGSGGVPVSCGQSATTPTMAAATWETQQGREGHARVDGESSQEAPHFTEWMPGVWALGVSHL